MTDLKRGTNLSHIFLPIESFSQQRDALLAGSDLLCTYGVALEELSASLKEWLEANPERRLLAFQEELVFSAHPQIRPVVLSDGRRQEQFQELAREYLFLKSCCFAPPSHRKQAEEIFAEFTAIQTSMHLVASDYSDLGERGFKNLITNIRRLPDATAASRLFGKYSDIPAIICGAGPSLTAELPFLRELQEHALLFAGGSALTILHQQGIQPHFGAAIDPDPPLERFPEECLRMPFFYQNRVSHQLLDAVQGPLLWVAGSGSMPLEAWITEQLIGSSTLFDGGWNVATFSLALAQKMGCNPIILVGMDLAASGEALYAPGVTKIAREGASVQTEDLEGRPLLSRSDWLLAAEWIEEFARSHSSTSFFNATQGGLGFRGIPALSLREVQKRVLDLPKWVPRSPVASQEQVAVCLQEIKQSTLRSEEYCNTLLKMIENDYPHFPEGKGAFVLAEVELEEELMHQKMLELLWNIWRPMLTRNLPASKPVEYTNKLLFFKKVLSIL